MKDWIPLFQTLVWPIFISIIIYIIWRWNKDIFDAIKNRIISGGEFSIGPSGVSLGIAPKLDEPTPDDDALVDLIDSAASTGKHEFIEELGESLYITHAAEFFRTAGASYDRRDVYTVKVKLFSHSEAVLRKVKKVVYVKHHSFKRRKEETTDWENNFELTERLWGQFNLRAEVHFDELEEPVILYRYLNF